LIQEKTAIRLEVQASPTSPAKIWTAAVTLKAMQAIEATGTINADGQLSLDQPLPVHSSRVRVIVLLPDPSSQTLEETKPDTASQHIERRSPPLLPTQPTNPNMNA
jgi:hypothetical protein